MAEDNNVQVFDSADVAANKGLAIVMLIFPVLFFLPLVMEDKKSSAYLRFFANQALILLIMGVGVSIITTILTFIVIGVVVGPLLGIFLTVCLIMAIVAAVNGEAKPMPLIGKISIIK